MRVSIIFILTFSINCYGQDSLSFRYLSPWVDTISIIDDIKEQINHKDTQVVILIKSNIYFFIVNQSDSMISIKQIDEQMDMVWTEIEINGLWEKLHGIDYTLISCGNSYWTLNLPPKKYIKFRLSLPDEPNGKQVNIRLVAEYQNRKIYSAPWKIYLLDYQIRQAGKPIY